MHATQGSIGGHRLAAGAAMPPLLLDDHEAIALAALAAACMTHEKVRFAYTRPNGETTRRLAEPHQLVASGRL